MQRHHTNQNKLSERAARFKTNPAQHGNSNNKTGRQSSNEHSYSDYEFDQQLVGTCELLEKCYLRLTSAPKESEVRPKHILVKSLEKVKEIWSKSHDYNRASELLKSIRQDMTVQGIRDEFSIEVYETHARFALQALDHPEFNICLSVLKGLYVEVSPMSPNKEEFTAYRLLYYLFIWDLADLTALVTELLLDRKGEKSDCIQHSLDVVLAWLSGSHYTLFQLYKSAPFHSSRVMDLFLPRERSAYFNVLMKAYRPWVPVAFITSELGFLDVTETSIFLDKLGGVIYTDSSKTKIDCKGTSESLK